MWHKTIKNINGLSQADVRWKIDKYTGDISTSTLDIKMINAIGTESYPKKEEDDCVYIWRILTLSQIQWADENTSELC